jgi:hypothetical protein
VRRLALLALATGLLLGASTAEAADPIMPLSDVEAGMHCAGLTVIRGTDISSFDAEVIDVVGEGPDGPGILIRVSGPAVDETGIAEGFSGSPVYCLDDHGVFRNAGAIAYGFGDYGNKLGLVTPIQAMLDQPVTPPSSARRLTRRERASLRRLATPLTVSGLTPGLSRSLTAAARSRGRPLYAAPSGPLGSFPPQRLRPGASLSVGLSSGDVAISAIGTVTYTNGSSVWGFGHPLEDAGRRNLLLQDAYVYTVVPNPNGDIGVSYKLAAPGHDLGTLTGDQLNGVTGRIGQLPPTTRVTVQARDLDTGRRMSSHTKVADELELGSPFGISPLGFVAPIAVLDANARVLLSEPGRTTATMCLRATVAGHARALRFCNRYVGDAALAGPGGVLAASDVDSATILFETAEIQGLHVTTLSADLSLRRGLAQAYLQRVKARKQVAAGGQLPVTITTRVARGANRTFTFDVPVPRNLPAGRYQLALSGPGPDGSESEGEDGLSALLAALLGDVGGPPGGGAKSFKGLATRFAALHNYDGLTAVFVGRAPRPHAPKPKGKPAKPRRRHVSGRIHAYRNPDLRIGGSKVASVRITRP